MAFLSLNSESSNDVRRSLPVCLISLASRLTWSQHGHNHSASTGENEAAGFYGEVWRHLLSHLEHEVCSQVRTKVIGCNYSYLRKFCIIIIII